MAKLTVDAVTEIASKYIQKAGYPFFRIVKIDQSDSSWTVGVDVGVFKQEMKKVVIDDSSGQVVNYG